MFSVHLLQGPLSAHLLHHKLGVSHSTSSAVNQENLPTLLNRGLIAILNVRGFPPAPPWLHQQAPPWGSCAPCSCHRRPAPPLGQQQLWNLPEVETPRAASRCAERSGKGGRWPEADELWCHRKGKRRGGLDNNNVCIDNWRLHKINLRVLKVGAEPHLHQGSAVPRPTPPRVHPSPSTRDCQGWEPKCLDQILV